MKFFSNDLTQNLSKIFQCIWCPATWHIWSLKKLISCDVQKNQKICHHPMCEEFCKTCDWCTLLENLRSLCCHFLEACGLQPLVKRGHNVCQAVVCTPTGMAAVQHVQARETIADASVPGGAFSFLVLSAHTCWLWHNISIDCEHNQWILEDMHALFPQNIPSSLIALNLINWWNHNSMPSKKSVNSWNDSQCLITIHLSKSHAS